MIFGRTNTFIITAGSICVGCVLFYTIRPTPEDMQKKIGMTASDKQYLKDKHQVFIGGIKQFSEIKGDKKK